MKSAVFMMALSMTISIVFTMESAIAPGTRCSKPEKGRCPFISGTCGQYNRLDDFIYCDHDCTCEGTNICPTDKDHALKVETSILFTCHPISKIRKCDNGEVSLVFFQPGSIGLVRCICSGGRKNVQVEQDGKFHFVCS
uniref:Conotoxin n=1 Tax=Conus praecellens TaxID=128530 RepID=A0A291C2U3_CONPC|nr:conotoxin [Conus praecellens]ATF27769.1 conotoxin [Conus praecellens]